jgi:hypothetical protein
MSRAPSPEQRRLAAERVKAAELAASQVHEHVTKWLQRRAKKYPKPPRKS